MGLPLFFLPNLPGATFIQGGTFIPDSRVGQKSWKKILLVFLEDLKTPKGHFKIN